MGRFRLACAALNRRIDRIWEEGGTDAKKPPLRQRMKNFGKEHKWDILFVAVMGCLLFYLSWILPFNEAPDEEMRYLIPQYIYRHGTLPAGWDEEIRNEIWGISYGFHPILPYIFGGYLMKLVGIFNSSDRALLMAARSVNIMIGMAFYWYVLQIGKKLFHNKVFRAFFLALLALLPQLLYLFTYVNTDGIAVFSSAILIYYWLEGIEQRWDRRTCTGLAVGLAICALSYFNAYGYGLFSIVVFVGSLAVFYRGRGAKACAAVILKRGVFVTALVFLLSGWWFIRSAILYDGDFLGMAAPDIYGEIYAMEEFKPSVKLSLSEQGVPLGKMLGNGEDGMHWFTITYRSTIGYFGYLTYPLGLDIYEIHIRLFALGFLGICLHLGLGLLYYVRRAFYRSRKKECPESEVVTEPKYNYRNCKMPPIIFCILQFSLSCCIIIPILLSMYYSYFSDFQAQGRYIMPMIVPLMYFTTAGIQRFVTLFFRKWFGYLMMVLLFYAVLHVFLGAFASVYIPTFVERLSSWSSIRFPWFSNISLLRRLISMLIPG